MQGVGHDSQYSMVASSSLNLVSAEAFAISPCHQDQYLDRRAIRVRSYQDGLALLETLNPAVETFDRSWREGSGGCSICLTRSRSRIYICQGGRRLRNRFNGRHCYNRFARTGYQDKEKGFMAPHRLYTHQNPGKNP